MKEQFEKIIYYMNDNLEKEFKIEEISREFGYSKFHFSREFKKISGVSPSEYIRGLRIIKGIDSLVNGKSVINSQLEAGYSSSGTFSTTFAENTGLSPKEYTKKINELYDVIKDHEEIEEDNDSLFYRNPLYPVVISPYKLTVYIEVPNNFQGIVFGGLFFKPNPNHQPAMGRCRVKNFKYVFYHLPKGIYYPMACGIRKSLNPFNYFQLKKALRACDGQSIEFPLTKDEEMTIKLRDKTISDPPLVINLPNILATGIKQQIIRNKDKFLSNIK